MAKKRKNGKASSRSSQDKRPKKSFLSRLKKHTFSITLLIVIAAGSAFGLSVYRDAWATEHDLSAIGNGQPVVVQVHDPSCPKCKKLMSNTKIALKFYDDQILFRVADINTSSGRSFQQDYNAKTITLVLFDKRGKRQSVLSGVQPVDVLEKAFDRLAARATR